MTSVGYPASNKMAYARILSTLFIAAQVGNALAGKVCTKALYTEDFGTCDGNKTEWGTYGKIITNVSLSDCQDACANDLKCEFVQYQPKLSPPSCHLYEDCDTIRNLTHDSETTKADVYACEVEGKTCDEVLFSKEMRSCDGRGDKWGRYGLQFEGLSKKACKQKCVSNADCQAVQFQAERYPTECHLYTDCDTVRNLPQNAGIKVSDVWTCTVKNSEEDSEEKHSKKEKKSKGNSSASTNYASSSGASILYLGLAGVVAAACIVAAVSMFARRSKERRIQVLLEDEV